MKIKRDSWHYRVVNFWTSNKPPKDVCSYVRQLILALFVWTALATFATVLVIFLLTGAYSIASMIFFGTEYPSESIMSVAANVTTTISFFVIALTGYHYIRKWIRTRDDKPKSTEKGLVRTFYEDKKSKMCSYIDFE